MTSTMPGCGLGGAIGVTGNFAISIYYNSRMPRRHTPQKHTPYQPVNNDKSKTRYPSKQAAQKAADERMLLHPQLELTVYQGLDGGWYLTRNTSK